MKAPKNAMPSSEQTDEIQIEFHDDGSASSPMLIGWLLSIATGSSGIFFNDPMILKILSASSPFMGVAGALFFQCVLTKIMEERHLYRLNKTIKALTSRIESCRLSRTEDAGLVPELQGYLSKLIRQEAQIHVKVGLRGSNISQAARMLTSSYQHRY